MITLSSEIQRSVYEVENLLVYGLHMNLTVLCAQELFNVACGMTRTHLATTAKLPHKRSLSDMNIRAK